MATSSERTSPPPFPDSEDQDLAECEGVGDRVSDEDGDGDDLFLSASGPTMSDMDPALPTTITNAPSEVLFEPPLDLMSSPILETETKPAAAAVVKPLVEAAVETVAEPVAELVEEPLDEFDDLVDLSTDVPSVQATAAAAAESPLVEVEAETPSEEACEDFVDLSGSDSDSSQEETLLEVPADSAAASSDPQDVSTALPPGDVATGSAAHEQPGALLEVDIGQASANGEKQPLSEDLFFDPLANLADAGPPPTAAVKQPAPPPQQQQPPQPPLDLFEDDPNDLFGESRHAKSAKQQPPQPSSLFGEVDEDIFGEPLGAPAAKKAGNMASREQRETTVGTKTSGLGGGGAGAGAGFGDVGGPLNNNYEKEPADIFSEEAVTIAPTAAKAAAAASSSRTNGVHGAAEEGDIFAEATVELSLDSPRADRKKNTTAAKPSTSATTLSSAADLSKTHSASLEELEEEEQEDNFDVNISVTNPEKIGDGMNAYMAYKVSTQTTLAMFRTKTFTVRRRFSDFLGLYEKLTEKHAPNGFIVPPPPEKSIMGMTKVKVGKEDSSSGEFVERRRAALERYLQRVVCHPSLLQDPDVREFLEKEELPRAVGTQALSGAGFLKMLNKATDAVSKMTIKMNESDVWFEEKLQEVEAADQQFRKLHGMVESLVVHRKELSLNTACFSKSVAMLGSSEDNTALSRALSQLAEVEDKMEQLHQEQASCDSFSFAELIADYIRLLGSVRGSFDHRMKAWQRWQDAQTMLQKKRESEAKLLWANKPDKLQQAKDDIAEWEAKVTQYEGDFDRVSSTVRKEVVRFEKEKVKNFKRQIIKYLEAQLKAQQQLIKYWDAFLPEAKAIA
ncbi:sorting nexin-1a isoform X1 [Gadus morhua]|uniref:Sorting nexin-1 n=2 Tax=Gadus morhua TaxID=8049 RepID=A0A8C5ABN4_GADMO|nr:sorting nexin-1-like isoform X1 [Gadus morhua]